ncbi:hypothetical protein BC941DRAFT_266384 [Chlamydoabsidia padenii]|nr:hypothetical protein BC941DRAFT_266384 [Chlamydoabsidia padenii]
MARLLFIPIFVNLSFPHHKSYFFLTSMLTLLLQLYLLLSLCWLILLLPCLKDSTSLRRLFVGISREAKDYLLVCYSFLLVFLFLF